MNGADQDEYQEAAYACIQANSDLGIHHSIDRSLPDDESGSNAPDANITDTSSADSHTVDTNGTAPCIADARSSDTSADACPPNATTFDHTAVTAACFWIEQSGL